MNISNTLLFSVDKNVRLLCIALSAENISIFAYVVCIYMYLTITSSGLNDDVKLTKF